MPLRRYPGPRVQRRSLCLRFPTLRSGPQRSLCVDLRNGSRRPHARAAWTPLLSLKGDGSLWRTDLKAGQNRLGLCPEPGRRVSAEHHPRIEEPVGFEEAEQLRPRLNASLPDLQRAQLGRLEAMRPWREVPLKPLQGLILGRAELRKREEGVSPRNRLTFGERRESHRARYEDVPERPIAQGVPHERPARRNPDGDPGALVGTSGPRGVMLPPSRRRRARRGSGRHGDDLVWLLCRDARREDRDADEYADRPSHPLEGTGGKNLMVPWPPWQSAGRDNLFRDSRSPSVRPATVSVPVPPSPLDQPTRLSMRTREKQPWAHREPAPKTAAYLPGRTLYLSGNSPPSGLRRTTGQPETIGVIPKPDR